MSVGEVIRRERQSNPASWRYLTLSQVSKKLGGRSRASLYRDILAGRLPNPIKLGRRSYFREVDIDAAMTRVESEADDRSVSQTSI